MMEYKHPTMVTESLLCCSARNGPNDGPFPLMAIIYIVSEQDQIKTCNMIISEQDLHFEVVHFLILTDTEHRK